MYSKIIFLCIVLHLSSASILKQSKNDEEEVYCYNTSTSHPQHKQFTTKTTYSLVKGSLEGSEISGCDPVKIWLLTRHGTIYPLDLTVDTELFDRLIESIDALTPPDPLCEEDKELLQKWKLNENISQFPDNLTEEGRNEMKTLAEDFKRVYEELFDLPEKVSFRYTAEVRNTESFHEFAKALFGENDVEVDSSFDTYLFKFYEKCDKWTDNNAKLNDSESNLKQFENSVLFTETIKGISDRLGLSENLSLKEVKDIWDMCRTDKALVVESLSPWCAAFIQPHVDVLEYHEDIELYYKTGHGEDLNSRLACHTVTDLIDHLENDNIDSPKSFVSFTDATTIQLFLTALGAHKDTLEPSTDSVADVKDRKWKSSEISPFASNVAIVIYNCPTAEINAQVKIFLNQKLWTPTWCTNNVCGFNEFVEQYRSYKVANCTDYFCSADTSGKSNIFNGMGVFSVVVSLILAYLH